MNLVGRLQLSTEKSQQEDNQSIVELRILRTQEAIIKIMKHRKRMNNADLQVTFREIFQFSIFKRFFFTGRIDNHPQKHVFPITEDDQGAVGMVDRKEPFKTR